MKTKLLSILISGAIVLTSLSIPTHIQAAPLPGIAGQIKLSPKVAFISDHWIPEDRTAADQNGGKPEKRLASTAAKGTFNKELHSPQLGQTAAPVSRPSGQPPLVILIQDLHLHYPTQKRILKTLNYLYDSNIVSGPVAIEGLNGDYDTSSIASYPAGKLKSKLVDYFMKKGELSGDEAFAVLRGEGHRLFGVDEGNYYALNRDLYKATFDNRKKLQAQLARMNDRMVLLKREYYGSSLKRLDKTEVYDVVSAEELLQKKLATLQDEKDEKRATLIRNLIEIDHSLSFLNKLLRQQTTLQEVRYVAQRLPRFVELTQKLLDLSRQKAVTPARSKRGPSGVKDTGSPITSLGDDVIEVAEIEEVLKASIDFYAVALMRDEPLARNTLALLRRNSGPSSRTLRPTGGSFVPNGGTPQPNGGTPQPNSGTQYQTTDLPSGSKDLQSGSQVLLSGNEVPKYGSKVLPSGSSVVALVVGGFHTAGLTRQFKKAGVGYVVLTPHIDEVSEDYHKLYESRLLGNHVTSQEVAQDLGFNIPETAVRALSSLFSTNWHVWSDAVMGVRTQGGGTIAGDSGKAALLTYWTERGVERGYFRYPSGLASNAQDVVIRKAVEASVRRYTTAGGRLSSILFSLVPLREGQARAYKVSRFLEPAEIALNRTEFTTLAEIAETGIVQGVSLPKELLQKAAKWLLDFRIHHELASTNWVSFRPFLLLSVGTLILVVIGNAFFGSAHPSIYLVPGFLGFAAAVRYALDRHNEKKMIEFDIQRIAALKSGDSSEYQAVKAILRAHNRQPSHYELAILDRDFEWLAHPDADTRKDFLKAAMRSLIWRGIRTMGGDAAEGDKLRSPTVAPDPISLSYPDGSHPILKSVKTVGPVTVLSEGQKTTSEERGIVSHYLAQLIHGHTLAAFDAWRYAAVAHKVGKFGDKVATDALTRWYDTLPFNSTVDAAEGDRDAASTVRGRYGLLALLGFFAPPEVSFANDPIEVTERLQRRDYLANISIASYAIAKLYALVGKLLPTLKLPDQVYLFSVSGPKGSGVQIDLDQDIWVRENMSRAANARKKPIESVRVTGVLLRGRHLQIMNDTLKVLKAQKTDIPETLLPYFAVHGDQGSEYIQIVPEQVEELQKVVKRSMRGQLVIRNSEGGFLKLGTDGDLMPVNEIGLNEADISYGAGGVAEGMIKTRGAYHDIDFEGFIISYLSTRDGLAKPLQVTDPMARVLQKEKTKKGIIDEAELIRQAGLPIEDGRVAKKFTLDELTGGPHNLTIVASALGNPETHENDFIPGLREVEVLNGGREVRITVFVIEPSGRKVLIPITYDTGLTRLLELAAQHAAPYEQRSIAIQIGRLYGDLRMYAEAESYFARAASLPNQGNPIPVRDYYRGMKELLESTEPNVERARAHFESARDGGYALGQMMIEVMDHGAPNTFEPAKLVDAIDAVVKATSDGREKNLDIFVNSIREANLEHISTLRLLLLRILDVLNATKDLDGMGELYNRMKHAIENNSDSEVRHQMRGVVGRIDRRVAELSKPDGNGVRTLAGGPGAKTTVDTGLRLDKGQIRTDGVYRGHTLLHEHLKSALARFRDNHGIASKDDNVLDILSNIFFHIAPSDTETLAYIESLGEGGYAAKFVLHEAITNAIRDSLLPTSRISTEMMEMLLVLLDLIFNHELLHSRKPMGDRKFDIDDEIAAIQRDLELLATPAGMKLVESPEGKHLLAEINLPRLDAYLQELVVISRESKYTQQEHIRTLAARIVFEGRTKGRRTMGDVDASFAALVLRVRGEWNEDTGMSLTLPKASRLFGLDQETMTRVLTELVRIEFLEVHSDGSYAKIDKLRISRPTRIAPKGPHTYWPTPGATNPVRTMAGGEGATLNSETYTGYRIMPGGHLFNTSSREAPVSRNFRKALENALDAIRKEKGLLWQIADIFSGMLKLHITPRDSHTAAFIKPSRFRVFSDLAINRAVEEAIEHTTPELADAFLQLLLRHELFHSRKKMGNEEFDIVDEMNAIRRDLEWISSPDGRILLEPEGQKFIESVGLPLLTSYMGELKRILGTDSLSRYDEIDKLAQRIVMEGGASGHRTMGGGDSDNGALVENVKQLSRVPDGIVAGEGHADGYGRVFRPDGRFFGDDGEMKEDLRQFMDSLSDMNVQEMIKAGIMYYDIRSGFWREHPEFTVAFAQAFAKKIQEKNGKKDGLVIHIAVDAYQHHFEAAQVFADAILRTGITSNGGGIYYWGVRNGGSIRNYAQLFHAKYRMGGDWVFFTQSHRTESDLIGGKLGINGEVYCGPDIRHVGDVMSGTLFDAIIDVKNGHAPIAQKSASGVVVNIADTFKNDLKVAADMIRATSAQGKENIPDDQLLAGARLYVPVMGRSIAKDVVNLLRGLGADVAVDSEEVNPNVSPQEVIDPNEHHEHHVLEVNKRIDEFAAAGDPRVAVFVDPDGDRGGLSSKEGAAKARTMPGSEVVQLVIENLASSGNPVTAISDMRTGVGAKDLEKALQREGRNVKVVPYEAGYSFFMRGMSELPADVAIENTLHFFTNPMTNKTWGAPQTLKRPDGKGYQGGDDAGLSSAYLVGAMVHQWNGRNPVEQLRWIQERYKLKPTVTGERKPALKREDDSKKYLIAERIKQLARAWFNDNPDFQVNFNDPNVVVVSGVHIVNNKTGAMVLTRYSNSGPGFTISGEAYRGQPGHENDELNEMLGLGYLLMDTAMQQLRAEGHEFTFDWKDAANLKGAFEPAKYGFSTKAGAADDPAAAAAARQDAIEREKREEAEPDDILAAVMPLLKDAPVEPVVSVNAQIDNMATLAKLDPQKVRQLLFQSLEHRQFEADLAEASRLSAKDLKQKVALGTEAFSHIEDLDGWIEALGDDLDVPVERLRWILISAIQSDLFMETVIQATGSSSHLELVSQFIKAGTFPNVLSRYFLDLVRARPADSSRLTPVAIEQFISPEALRYAEGVLKLTVSAPTDPAAQLQVDRDALEFLRYHFRVIRSESAKRAFNYRGGVKEYYEKEFRAKVAPQLDSFVREHFPGHDGRTLKYVVSSGIGANEEYTRQPARIHNDTASPVRWIVVDNPAEWEEIKPADATEQNTLFFDISRSGNTEETVKTAEFTHRNFPTRIMAANKGPLRTLAERWQGTPNHNIQILPLPPDIGGRLMRRLTPMVYAPMYLAGMDVEAYVNATDRFDGELAFDRPGPNLAIDMAEFFLTMFLAGGRSQIALFANGATPDSAPSHSMNEFMQLGMEGFQKRGSLLAVMQALLLPRSSHLTIEGVLGQFHRFVALIFLGRRSGVRAHEKRLTLDDVADPAHAGLSMNDVLYGLALGNADRIAQLVPTFRAEFEQPTLETAAAIAGFFEDSTVYFCALTGQDPNSNPEVASVRQLGGGHLARIAAAIRGSATAIMAAFTVGLGYLTLDKAFGQTLGEVADKAIPAVEAVSSSGNPLSLAVRIAIAMIVIAILGSVFSIWRSVRARRNVRRVERAATRATGVELSQKPLVRSLLSPVAGAAQLMRTQSKAMILAAASKISGQDELEAENVSYAKAVAVLMAA